MKKLLFLSIFFIAISSYSQAYITKRPLSQAGKLNQEYCSGVFKSADGTIIDLTDEATVIPYLNILDWLKGRIPGLEVYYTRLGIAVPYLRGERAGLFIDEIPVSDISSLPVSDIAIIKIIKTPFAGGFANSGAIAIYTFKGKDETDER